MTEKSKKESKGWWNKDIKKARDDFKNANNRYKKRQSPANLNAVVKHKETLQNLIKHSKSEACKKNSEFLNSSKDSTQFWHSYHKVLGTKKDTVIEPLYDNALNTYIFKDEDISNILYNYHINKEKEDDKYDNFFKVKINNELGNILSENVHDEPYVFFDETHAKTAIRGLNKNSSQALLPLIEQMLDAISSGKYGIAVMADIEGAFDTVWREGTIYKLHKAGINNNLLSVFSSFLSDRYSRNLVNSHTSDWFQTTLGAPQGSILSPLIFLVYTADLTMEEVPNNCSHPSPSEPRESKYADDVEFWRVQTNIFQAILDTQIAIINLQTWCSKWRISINTMKTTYMIFCNKKNTPAPPPIPAAVNGTPLKKVSSQRVLGIIIDEDLTFTPHIEYITSRCKKAYNRLTLFSDMRPDLAVQIFKSFIRSKLEYGSIIWGQIFGSSLKKCFDAGLKSYEIHPY